MAAQSKFYANRNLFTEEHISKNAFRVLMLVCLAYVAFQQEFSFQVGPKSLAKATVHERSSSLYGDATTKPQKVKIAKATMASYERVERKRLNEAEVKNLANQFHNVSFLLDPNLASVKDVPQEVVEAKLNTCRDYVKKYRPIAELEERKTGVPAYITLAQGILESDAGGSRLTKAAANHFGIKCFSKKCKKGHCKNFTDDTHKDFFIVYKSAWQSFRAHSDFLKSGNRYAGLFRLRKNDYKGWAHGLKSAGYATDKHYAEKLIKIIEALKLA